MTDDILTQTPPSSEPPSAQRPGAVVVAVLTIVLGAVVALGAVANGVLSTLDIALRQPTERSLAVGGVTSLEVDAAAADVEIVFADVTEATLEVVGAARGGWTFQRDGGWTFERDGDRLRVATPDRRFLGWLFGGNGRATLTLPESLEGADAALSLSAGSLTATGSFRDLTVDLAAGRLTVSGQARTLDVDVSAGNADLALAGVDEARFSLAAGDADARLTGSAPDEVGIDVSAGSLALTLPDASYAVRSDVSVGSLDARSLRTASTSAHTIDVKLSAGSVTLRPGR